MEWLLIRGFARNTRATAVRFIATAGEPKPLASRVFGMPSKHRVVDHIVGHLARTGVEYIFGVDGANIEDLYDAAYFRSDITAVLAKHEFSAATMADGYSRSGAGLGVVAATSGGGALNLLPGLGESFTSRIPVLALVGQPATTMDGRGSFQDTSGRNGSLNAEALFSQASVFCRRIMTPADIVSALPAAVAARQKQAARQYCCCPKTFNSQTCTSIAAMVDVTRKSSNRDPSVTRIPSCAHCAARTDR